MKTKWLSSCLLLLAVIFSQPSLAVLSIKITQGIEDALPIAVVPFGWTGQGEPPERFEQVIGADLYRTGRFSPLPVIDLPETPTEGSQIDFSNWRRLGVENIIIGRMQAQPGGGYLIQFQLFDVFKGVQLAGYRIPAQRNELRRTAHQVADIIYEKLTGERGAFATHIAYVTEHQQGLKKSYSLQVADSDGYAPQSVVESSQPLLSPSWSPDGQKLAYVSFENLNSSIYIQDLSTGKREKISSFKGINSAPVWSPDGQRMAMVLSKDGNPEIYLLDLRSRKLRRLTRNSAIDTEPDWAPDGKSLVFTSDRGGRPQIYRLFLDDGRPKRLTFEGKYNARARFSPSGEEIIMVHGVKGKYHIAIMDLETRAVRVLTRSALDESPSYAPNGAMVIYATSDDQGGALAAVSVDGRIHQRLSLSTGAVREPCWSPFLN